MTLLAARAPGERGIHHYIDEWSYLGGGLTRARCGLWSATWRITPEPRAQDCPLCVMAVEQEAREARARGES